MPLIPLDALSEGGLNVPVCEAPSYKDFSPPAHLGASRYRHTLPSGEHFDALLVNKGADVLVVTLHGATDRAKTKLPRFERVRTMTTYGVSSMYFADPALWRNERIQLAWYTGWGDIDVHRMIADWSVVAAHAIGASRIVFSGASGGGFAALQVSALVPGSLCLPFNPQTSVYGYLVNGTLWGAQRTYQQVVWPGQAPNGVNENEDWTASLDDRVSPLRRYSQPLQNYVLFVINRNEFHYQDHYFPWLAAAARGGNLERVRAVEYAGGTVHNPPTQQVFSEGMDKALNWVRELPPCITSETSHTSN